MVIGWLYMGDFFSLLAFFLITYFILVLFLLIIKKPTKNSYILAIPLSFILYISTLAAPIPNSLEEDLKEQLSQLKENNVKSNGMLNTVLMGCDNNKGYLRGNDYRNAVEWYGKDMDIHLKENNIFTVYPKKSFKDDIDICDFIINYNNEKHSKYN